VTTVLACGSKGRGTRWRPILRMLLERTAAAAAIARLYDSMSRRPRGHARRRVPAGRAGACLHLHARSGERQHQCDPDRSGAVAGQIL
jgi:hypothetical protein